MNNQVPKIDVGTKVRTVGLFVALLNQILAVFNISPIPFDSEQIELVVSTIFTGVMAVWAWWKNNNITKKARSLFSKK
jgi:SPP1 family holin